MRYFSAVIFALFAMASHAQQMMSPEEGAKFEQRLRSWAQTYYPAMTSAKRLPDDIVFAFLVNSTDGVIQHTAGFKGPDGSSIPQELARFFPGRAESEFGQHGAGCLVPRANEPRYCVYFAAISK
jgi:hypothetical protein